MDKGKEGFVLEPIDCKTSIEHWDLFKAKEELGRMDYTKIDYPFKATADNWDVTVSDERLPKLEGALHFIYDSEITLLYIEKSKKTDAALRSHLVRKTSKSTNSILGYLKGLISKS